MIKTIAFDCGGVITTDIDKQILDFASKRLQVEEKELKTLMNTFEPDLQTGKIDHVEFWRRIIKGKNIKLPDSKLSDILLTPYLKYSKVNKKILSLAKRLSKNYIVGLISNTQEPHASVNRKRTYPYFNPVILSNEVGLLKPDSKIFELYLKKTKCNPNEMVFIDNTGKNLVEAKKMGIHTILFKNYEALIRDLKNLEIT